MQGAFTYALFSLFELSLSRCKCRTHTHLWTKTVAEMQERILYDFQVKLIEAHLYSDLHPNQYVNNVKWAKEYNKERLDTLNN